MLTYPQAHTVTVQQSALGGPVAIGAFQYLPPTLTAKWNFIPDGTIRPYIGIGVNLALISSVNLNHVQALNDITGNIDLDSSSVGLAGQAGVDFKVADHYFINADVKYMKLQSDVPPGVWLIPNEPVATAAAQGQRQVCVRLTRPIRVARLAACRAKIGLCVISMWPARGLR